METKTSKGRKSSDIWTLFTSDDDPQKHNSAVRKHCKETVTYSRKSEQVIRHLNKKCTEFRKLMYQTDSSERPDWYESKKRHKTTVENVPLPPSSSSSSFLSDPGPTSMVPKKQVLMTDFGIPKLTTSQHERFKKAMAMHYYVTGNAFQRIEEPYLLKACQILRPDVKLPTRHELSVPFLSDAYDELKIKIDSHISTSRCVTVVSSQSTRSRQLYGCVT